MKMLFNFIQIFLLLSLLGCNSQQSANTTGGSSSSGSGSGSGGGTPPSGGLSLSGQVDSHLVDRWAGNAVYLFAGNVTPDDRDGDSGDPLEVATVSQSESGCDWHYTFSGLAAGEYTLAFTDSANLDDPATNDALTFSKVTQLTIGSSDATQDFTPSSVIRVGPGRAYTTVKAAAAAANNGDVIEIDAGVYQDDISVWRQDNITLRGVGGRAHMQAVNPIDYVPGDDQANGMGIWVIKGSNVSIENIEFSGATVPVLYGANGAGIRAQSGGDISICNGVFHDNENGLLGNANTLLVEHSEFNHNGLGEYGRTHNIYVDGGNKFIFRYNYTHHAYIGHNVKTRATENYVLYNRIMDEDSGRSSYDIDVPDGGLTYIIGNLVQQGVNTDNSTIVAYAAEGAKTGRINHLYLINNTLVNDYNGGTFVSINPGSASAPVSASVKNNLFVGNGTAIGDSGGVATSANNLVTSNAGLVDIINYDYHLTAGSPARNAGGNPGSGDGVDLTPVQQYVHPRQYEVRPQDGTIDIGAYEYVP